VDSPESFVRYSTGVLPAIVLGPDSDRQRGGDCESDTREALHDAIMPSLP
jgi:hypothetical protein